MAKYQYKGYEFSIDHDPTEDDWNQTKAYIDSLPPKEQKETSEVSDKKPGYLDYLNPANIYQSVKAGVQGDLLGQHEEAAKNMAEVRSRLQQGAESNFLDTAKGVAAGAADIAVGLPVMIPAAAWGGLHAAVSGKPSWGLEKGKELMNDLSPSTIFGFNQKNTAYQGMMAPFTAISEGLETSGKGYGEIAGVLGASEEAKKEIAATVEGGLLLGLTGKATHEAYKKFKDAPDPTAPAKDLPQNPEHLLLKDARLRIEKSREAAQNLALELEKEIVAGNANKEVIDAAQRLDDFIKKHNDDIDELDKRLGREPEKREVKDDTTESLATKEVKLQELFELEDRGVTLTPEQEQLRYVLTNQLLEGTEGRPPRVEETIPVKKDLDENQETALRLLEETPPIDNSFPKIDESLLESKPPITEKVKDPFDAADNPILEERAAVLDLPDKLPVMNKQDGYGRWVTRDTSGANYKIDDPKLLTQIQHKLNLAESHIKRLNSILERDEQGISPSGGIDVGIIQSRLDSVKAEWDRLSEFRDRVTEVQQKNKVVTKEKESFLPTIDENIIDQQLKQSELLKSVEDILSKDPYPIQKFIDHPELFYTIPNSKIHIDKKLIEADIELTKTIEAFLNELGLHTDSIYFVQAEGKSILENSVNFYGNTTLVRLDMAEHSARVEQFRKLAESEVAQSIFKGLSKEAQQHLITAKIVAHELGHILSFKWLRDQDVSATTFKSILNDFNEWLKKNKIQPTNIATGIGDLKKFNEYHSHFSEYFAERIAAHLTKDTLLNRFSNDNTIGKQLKHLASITVGWLRKLGIKVDQKYIFDDLLQDIISRNKENIKKQSEQMKGNLELNLINEEILKNTKEYPFAYRTYEEIKEHKFIDPETGDKLSWLHPNSETAHLSTAALNTIGASYKLVKDAGKGMQWVGRKSFGKTTLSNVLRNQPLVRRTERMIRFSEYQAAEIGNKLWYGDIPKSQWEAANIVQKFSKIKDPDSPYMVVKQMTDLESNRLKEVFKQGFDSDLEYATTLQTLGQHLTPIEKKYFNVLSKMFERQYDESVKVQQGLRKKHILPKRNGWYPSVRRGDYSVSIHYGTSQTKVYHQQFGTKAAAEAFKKQAESFNFQHLTVGDIENIKDQATAPNLMQTIDIVEQALLKAFPNTFFSVNVTTELSALKTRLLQRGGVLGQHHQFRSNIPGAKGSELFKTNEELGAGFKEALQNSAQEYTAGLRNMMLYSRIEPMLQHQRSVNSRLVENGAIPAAEQMLASALGKVPNTLEGFDTVVKNSVDNIAKYIVTDLFKGEFKPEGPIYDKIQNTILSTFYLFKVLPKLSLIVTQLLSPIQSVRHMAYDGGLRAMHSFGRGLYDLMSGDPDLMHSLYRVSQKSNIIEPQFMEALGLKAGEKKTFVGITTEFIKNWILLKRPTELSDIFSRAVTYSMMYRHYRDLGYSLGEAEMRAMHGTDSTMAAYSSGETAPIFKNLGGIVGESMRPLQTYGQTQLGNFVSDFKHFKTKNPSTWAPMMMYGATATLMGGTLTGVVMAQYEALRLLLEKVAPSYKLPSILDVIRSMPNLLEGVVEDPEAQTKLLAYGVTSQVTGIDIGASARTPVILPDNLATVALGMIDGKLEIDKLFPAATSMGKMGLGAGTLLHKGLGGNVKDVDTKKAVTDLLPAGPIGFLGKEALGVNTTKILGKNTNQIAIGKDMGALMPRGPTEEVSNFLGSKSTEERYAMDKYLQFTKEEKIRAEQVQNNLTLWRDTGDSKYMLKLIDQLKTEKELKSAIESQIYTALTPAELRQVMNKKGTISERPDNVRKLGKIFKFGTQ